ncbi:ABC-three component system protein [Pseudoalteromonas sp. ASV78]|uniref:ABC-three component system protein n=1 Tax=Pseudoalteromonas sp. ASV78 TaxID=3397851 RepID=UPI0039FCBDDD
MAFDASPSWSGFNYQGKVALYYALTLINEASVETDFSNNALMLEKTEDFEILLNGNSVSIHQVKAYNSSAYSQYSDALLEITLELYKHPRVIGEIHTWKPINSKLNCQDFEASIKDDLKILLDEYLNTNPKDGSSIIEKAASTDRNKPKKAAILKTALPELTAIQLFHTLNSIYSGQNNAINRLNNHIYKDGNRFCDLDKINEIIKSEISYALEIRNITCTPQQLEKTFHYFLGMMDKYIIQRHKTKQQEEKISIAFTELIEALENDHEDIGLEYLAYEFKNKFAHQIDEYLSDPDDYTSPEDNTLCNLKEASKFLLKLSPMDLWKYYRSFCPHIDLAHDNNTTNALATDLDGIRYVLIKILHEINFDRVSHNPSKYNFSYRTTIPPHKSFLPTTITHTARVTQVERKIISNPNMCETLFEVENLIYSGLEPHTFYPKSMVHTEAPQAEDEDPRTKRDDILKQITLVPIPMAKEMLK